MRSSPTIVCGEVNAKNRMGGYVGFRRFVADLDAQEVTIAPGEPGDLSRPEEQTKAYEGILFDLQRWPDCPA